MAAILSTIGKPNTIEKQNLNIGIPILLKYIADILFSYSKNDVK